MKDKNNCNVKTMIEMKWTEVEELAQNNAVVLLPLGVVEEHGPHLSLGTDTYLVYSKCVLIKETLEEMGIKSVIAPPFYWGVNKATGDFPGCFTSRVETVEMLIFDIMLSLKKFGFKNVFGVNHHGDTAHGEALIGAFKKAVEGIGINARYVLEHRLKERYNIKGVEPYITLLGPEVIETPDPGFRDIHAGAVETAQMLKYYPEQVDLQLTNELEPQTLDDEGIARWMAGGHQTRELTPGGYLGYPAYHEKVIVQFEKYAYGIAQYIKQDSI